MSQPQTMTDITHDHELDVLSQIHHNQMVKQREIAHLKRPVAGWRWRTRVRAGGRPGAPVRLEPVR